MLASRAMEHVRAFVALVAPWLAEPGDGRMHPAVVIVTLMLLGLGAATVGYAGILAVREFLPPQTREALQ